MLFFLATYHLLGSSGSFRDTYAISLQQELPSHFSPEFWEHLKYRS